MLAHHRLDPKFEIQRLSKDLRGFQRPRIGARQDPLQSVGCERGGNLPGLPAALLGQSRVGNAGIDPRDAIDRVELRLAVAHDDHG